MQSGNLYFTIGLPRSGKSTECKSWLNYQAEIIHNKKVGRFHDMCHYIPDNMPRVVVTPDHWRLALGHRYNWFVEPIVFSHVQIAIKALIADYDVLVDDTHTTIESLKRIYECSPNAIGVPMGTTAEICKERAIKTGQPDLCIVIDRMSINMSITYGPKFDKIEKTLTDVSAEVLAHSSRKVVI
jgi:hypothetical protein